MQMEMHMKMKNKKKKTPTTSQNRNLDNLKLLFSDIGVKQVINEARVFLKIPVGGFCGEDQSQAIERWHIEAYKRSSQLLKSGLVALQKKLQGGEIDKFDFEEERDVLLRNLPENYLTNTANLIVEENNLPISYRDSIRAYIISGTISAPALPFFVVTRYDERNPSDSVRSVTVQFNSKITNADLKPLQKYVNILFARELPDAPKPIKNIDNKIKAEEMFSTPVKDSVTMESDRRTAREIAEYLQEETNIPVKASEVHNAHRELEEHRKKRRKKSFGK